MPKRISLSRASYYTELGQQELSNETRIALLGAVAAYIHKLTPRTISREAFAQLTTEVSFITFDNANTRETLVLELQQENCLSRLRLVRIFGEEEMKVCLVERWANKPELLKELVDRLHSDEESIEWPDEYSNPTR